MNNDEVNKKFDVIKENQKVIVDAVTELKMAVCGSEKIGVKGLVKKVNEHSKYIENDKKRKYMLAGAVTVIASILGAFWNKLIS